MYRKILKEFIYEIDNQAPNTIKSFENNILADENFLKNFFKKIYEKNCFILEFEKENIDKIKWAQIDNRVSAYMIVLSTINLKCILYINDALYDNENVELLFTWAIGLLMKTYELHNTKEIIKKMKMK